MARIIILDDNRSTGSLLKKALEHEDHHVRRFDRWPRAEADATELAVDLVLIHQTQQDNSGWAIFNELKSSYQQIPVMLYVLPDYKWTSADWIVKAVHETLPPNPQHEAKPIPQTLDDDLHHSGMGRLEP